MSRKIIFFVLFLIGLSLIFSTQIVLAVNEETPQDSEQESEEEDGETPSDIDDYELFTESDLFKMYSRNQIYLYEPCESTNNEEDDGDPFSSTITIIIGGDSTLKKLASASASFAPGAAGIGIYHYLTHHLDGVTIDDNFNPLEAHNSLYGYMGWTSGDFSKLKKAILNDERFTEVKTDLKNLYDNPGNFPSASDKLKNYIIAAEFVYYYQNFGRIDISGGDNEDEAETKKDAIAGAKNFCKKISSNCNNISITDEEYNEYLTLVTEQAGGLSMVLTSSDTTNYLTTSLIIGDSLTYHSESNENDSDHFGRQISNRMIGFETNNIDAQDGRKFEEINNVINSHKNKNIKYIILELGNNDCTGVNSCSLDKSTVENAIKTLNTTFQSTVDGNPYIILILGYRGYQQSGGNYSETAYNEIYREIANDNSEDFKKVLIGDWPSWIKNNGGEDTLLQNVGHPTEKGAQELAKFYEDLLIKAQRSLLNSRDTEPCERAIRTRRTEVGAGDETGDDEPEDFWDIGGGGDAPIGSRAIKDRLKKYWMGQCNEPWSSVPFSRKNICTDGCANTAFSMALSILYDKKITPKDTITWAGKWRTRASTSISIIETMVQGARKAGFSGMRASSSSVKITQSNVDNLLGKGQIVFMSCRGGIPCARKGKVTDGHFIAIVGIDPDKPNNYLIANSHGKDPYETKQSYPKSDVINMYKGGGRSRTMWREY